ncbi:thiamine-monophosphate kinase [Chlamydiota bacterium]
MTRLSKESELIDWIRQNVPSFHNVHCGIGDDAAVLFFDEDNYQLFKVDSIAQEIHFQKKEKPYLIGRKALARPLSDIAAMGGTPEYALIAFSCDKTIKKEDITHIFNGIFALANEFNVTIVGGETIRIEKGLSLSVSLIGKVKKSDLCLRKGAVVPDKIAITGTLDIPMHGKHLSFIPRLKEGAWLAKHFSLSAMIDITDGFIGDLGKIVNINNCGAKIDLKKIPFAEGIEQETEKDIKKLIDILCLGEQYELLFTCSDDEYDKIQRAQKNFKTPITLIGEIINTPKTICAQFGKEEYILKDTGYDHFDF